ncbi:MAG: 16S rRNA (cytidine(1402)-2'-O)-methyltransferase [Deltaproteobacteria bacterium]|nr:16S rRNA (cytidine(1402)-2'-O)-methyltransferase [Deltaproteobacteria bacterium]
MKSDAASRQNEALSGRLWVVATPLGNPGDLSPRAREVLAAVDCVLAEDTRRSGLLLAACGVKAAGFMSLHEHNEQSRLKTILAELQQGRNFALVSDAGTPLLSDPGYRLVRACREQGILVSPLPGPSAPLAALSAAGLPPQPYVFLGFPPRKAGEVRKFFRPYLALPATIAFFERKDRLKNTLELLYELCGDREICIARELTKTHEEFILTELAKFGELPELLGEITVLLGPPSGKTTVSPSGMSAALPDASAGAVSDTQAEILPDLPLVARPGAVPGVTDQSEVLRLAAVLQKNSAEGFKPRRLARQVRDLTEGWRVDDIYVLLQGMDFKE